MRAQDRTRLEHDEARRVDHPARAVLQLDEGCVAVVARPSHRGPDLSVAVATALATEAGPGPVRHCHGSVRRHVLCGEDANCGEVHNVPDSYLRRVSQEEGAYEAV